MNNQKYW